MALGTAEVGHVPQFPEREKAASSPRPPSFSGISSPLSWGTHSSLQEGSRTQLEAARRRGGLWGLGDFWLSSARPFGRGPCLGRNRRCGSRLQAKVCVVLEKGSVTLGLPANAPCISPSLGPALPHPLSSLNPSAVPGPSVQDGSGGGFAAAPAGPELESASSRHTCPVLERLTHS